MNSLEKKNSKVFNYFLYWLCSSDERFVEYEKLYLIADMIKFFILKTANLQYY